MSYVEQNLMNGEQVIYQGKLHWAIFLQPAALFLLGMMFFAIRDWGACIASILVLLAILTAVSALMTYMSSEFAVTNKRVLLKTGFLRRTSLELFLNKVEGIGVDQPILGRLLGFGTIVVTGTGGTRSPFPGITDPLEFRRQVQNQLAPA